MDLPVLLSVLQNINGCTFATVDAETRPQPGVRCEITGERVMLFTNKNVSGYNEMVRRRLAEAGKDPDSFHLSDLPWGERLPDSPIISHKERYYIQCIVLSPGKYRYFLGGQEFTAEELDIKKPIPNQGLDASDAVYVHTYRIDNITRIALMGEVFTAQKRETLRIKA